MGSHAAVARGLQLVFGAGLVVGLTDEQLLERFLSRRDDDGASFEAIVQRHGLMVWGVCRDILRDPHAAEDAFQATFLVLIQKARSVRVQGSLGRWLYGVAHRVAVRARSDALRRQARERTWTVVEPEQVDAAAISEDHALLHEELSRLPARYRTAIVLCHLEGLTHEEAASRLKWPVGTVRSRLARGRRQLRDRLLRRGLTPAVALAGLARSSRASSAVPRELIHFTTRAAVTITANSTGVVSSTALALSKGVLVSMFFAKMKLTAIGLLTASAVVIAGAGVVARQAEKPDATKGETATKAVEALGTDGSAPKIMLQGDVRIEPKPADPTKRPPGGTTLTAEKARIQGPGGDISSDRMLLSLLQGPGAVASGTHGVFPGPASPANSGRAGFSSASAGELAVRLQAARRVAAIVKTQFERAVISREEYDQAESAADVIEAQINDQVSSLRDQEELLKLRIEACELEVAKAAATADQQAVSLAELERLARINKNNVSDGEMKKQQAACLVPRIETNLRQVALREAQLLLQQTTRRREAFEKALAPAAKAEPPADTTKKPEEG